MPRGKRTTSVRTSNQPDVLASLTVPILRRKRQQQALRFIWCSVQASTKAFRGWKHPFSDRIPTEEERRSSALSLRPRAGGGLHRKPGQGCPTSHQQKCCQLYSEYLRSLRPGPSAVLPFFRAKLAGTPGSDLFSLAGHGSM